MFMLTSVPQNQIRSYATIFMYKVASLYLLST